MIERSDRPHRNEAKAYEGAMEAVERAMTGDGAQLPAGSVGVDALHLLAVASPRG